VLAPTANSNIGGEVADLAAQVERLKAEIAALTHAANRIRPTGKVYTIQAANPLRELDQPTAADASIAKTLVALIYDLAESGVIRIQRT